MYSNDDGIELEMSSRQRTFGSRVAVIRCQCNNMTTEMSWRYIVVVPAKGDGQRYSLETKDAISFCQLYNFIISGAPSS
jgi:hypothetical protein